MQKLLWVMLIFLLIVGCDEMKRDDDQTKEVAASADLVGTWDGAIEIPGQSLKISLKFAENNEATKGSISIPIQNVEDFSLSDISQDGNDVSFNMPLPGQQITFTGTINEKNISGVFTQNGQNFPFSVEKGEATANNAEAEENLLTVETNIGTLSGSVVTPKEGKQFPVALIIPGSGPTDRNGNSPGLPGKNNSLKMLAEGLADNGIASLRYDKRGAGKNAQAIIAEPDMRFDQFIADAEQWIAKLKKDKRFTDIIVIGHSQGSLVGMMAAQNTDVDAFISIAGTGRPINQVLTEQLKTLPDNLYQESQQILDVLRKGKTVNEVNEQLMSVFKPSVQPFLISWMQYNPTEEIKELTIPTLIINGKNDIQVPITDAEKLAEAKPDATLLLIDKMNHLLKEAPADRAGNIATYSDPNLPLAEGLMKGITEFLTKNM